MPNLTAAEVEVLRHVAAGGTTDAIARRLGVTPHAIKSRIRQASVKLRARNRVNLVALAIRNGDITTDHVRPAQPRSTR